MATSSSAATPTGPQVFINFRGEDVRRHFISYLAHALREANINVFIDDDELVGTDLVNLLVRIQESRIALVIFSKDYTSSDWCLDELAKIKECKDQGSLNVIPIFYRIEPSVVKYLKGDFGDTFREMERRHLHEPERSQKWEEALKSIPETLGMPLLEKSDRSDREFINAMVIEVQKLLSHIAVRGSPKIESDRQGGFLIPARKLVINNSEDPEKWTWSSIYDATYGADIEIATMINTLSLKITGNFHTRKLTSGTKYEVVFLASLSGTASGWDKPVTLTRKLVMRDGSDNEHEESLYLDDYIGDNWVDIQMGEFEAPPKNEAARITFSIHQYVHADQKSGLVVKGVAIRPVQ